MAISKATASSLATFARYNKASAGNAPANGVFAMQAASSGTHYTSSDGLSWTAIAISNPYNTLNWCLYSTAKNLWYFGNSGMNNILGMASAASTGKPRTTYNGSPAIGNTFNGGGQFLDTGVDILFGWGGGIITDIGALYKWTHPNTGYTMVAPAYDGGTTWATAQTNNTSSAYYTTAQGTTGDGIIPYAVGASGYYGWSNWSSFNMPTTAVWTQIKYYNGYWYVLTNGGVIYYTANIATASPSWTNQGTYLNSPLFKVNNELWMVPFWGSGTTAYRITSGGAAWSSITLPSNKQVTGMAYGNGVYVMACSDGTVHRSTTGASGSWSNVSTGATGTTTFNVQTIDFGAA